MSRSVGGLFARTRPVDSGRDSVLQSLLYTVHDRQVHLSNVDVRK